MIGFNAWQAHWRCWQNLFKAQTTSAVAVCKIDLTSLQSNLRNCALCLTSAKIHVVFLWTIPIKLWLQNVNVTHLYSSFLTSPRFCKELLNAYVSICIFVFSLIHQQTFQGQGGYSVLPKDNLARHRVGIKSTIVRKEPNSANCEWKATSY